MQINFTGNKPEKNRYSYAVKQNNNSNQIIFELNRNEIANEEGIYLENLTAFAKIKGSEIVDKVPLTSEYEGEEKIKFDLTLERKHTSSRVLDIQLQFEGQGDVVWQTEIVQLVLSDTIKADEYIENKYPSVLVNHEERIQGLEEHEMNPNDYYDKSETNALLDRKQDVLTFDNVPTANSENPVKSGGVFLSLQNVLEIAEGKTQSFTLSAETNPTFNSEEAYIEVSSFVDINGNTIDTTKLHVGDIILVTQLEIPDRWVANIENGVATLYQMETTKVDLSAYFTKAETRQYFVDLESEQTITGVKTFNADILGTFFKIENNSNFFAVRRRDGNAYCFYANASTMYTRTILPISDKSYDLGKSDDNYKNLYLSGRAYIPDIVSSSHDFVIYREDGITPALIIGNASETTSSNYTIVPRQTNTINLGNASKKWNKAFVNFLNDGTNEVSVSEIANGIFNVINASDITNNTLSQEQYDLITNGKPTLIKGTILGLLNPIILSLGMVGTTQYGSWFGYDSSGVATLNNFTISSNRVITSRGMQDNAINVRGLFTINGKIYPDYPTDTTKNYTMKFINGQMVWVEDN